LTSFIYGCVRRIVSVQKVIHWGLPLGFVVVWYGADRPIAAVRPMHQLLITPVKLEFHDADTDTNNLARILANTSDTRDSLKLLI